MNKVMNAVLAMVLVMVAGKALASENSSYAGEETWEIKALSKSQIDGLLSGKGIGYAKAAELNGYPGPAHVLELHEELSLKADQHKESEVVFSQMENAAKDLGADLVAAERALDEAFRKKMIDESLVSELVKKIGAIESRLRAVHLSAHVRQTEILNDQQISKYMTLRGYDRAGQESHHKTHHIK